MRTVITALVLVAAAPAAAGSPVAGFAFHYVDADYGGPTVPSTAFNIGLDNQVVTAGGDQGPGARNTVRSQTDYWLNRIGITSDATRGFVYGSASSVFAINQRVTGAPGATAHIEYDFGVDGSFYPGSQAHYLPAGVAPSQNLTVYLLAYRGVSSGYSEVTDAYGRVLYFDSSAGHLTLSRAVSAAGYSNTLPAPFAAATACFGSDTRCSAGGSFADRLSVGFDLATGEDYFIVGYISSQTDGQTDFFHTVKLSSVTLAPEFDLVSGDGGALVRNPNGSFHLTVPEPATWAMLLTGFGLSGAAMRRRRAVARMAA